MIHYQTLEMTEIQANDIIEIRGINFAGGYDPEQLVVEVVRPSEHYQLAVLDYNSGDYYRTGMPFVPEAQSWIEQL
ncbi:MAG: hypothetical protein ACRCZC_02005, partial [Culicoidibacterales bacterium]